MTLTRWEFFIPLAGLLRQVGWCGVHVAMQLLVISSRKKFRTENKQWKGVNFVLKVHEEILCCLFTKGRVWMKVIVTYYSLFVLCWCHRLKHRGPDWSGLHQHGDNFLAHQRLAIVDPASGDQPLFNEDQSIIVTVGLMIILWFISFMIYKAGTCVTYNSMICFFVTFLFINLLCDKL